MQFFSFFYKYIVLLKWSKKFQAESLWSAKWWFHHSKRWASGEIECDQCCEISNGWVQPISKVPGHFFIWSRNSSNIESSWIQTCFYSFSWWKTSCWYVFTIFDSLYSLVKIYRFHPFFFKIHFIGKMVHAIKMGWARPPRPKQIAKKVHILRSLDFEAYFYIIYLSHFMEVRPGHLVVEWNEQFW